MKKHFVSRYKYSHDKRRQQFKQWLKKGMVKLIDQDKQGFLYSEVEGFEIIKVQSRRQVKFEIKESA